MKFRLFSRNKPRTEVEAVLSIRLFFADMGRPLDEYTDEQIREGVMQFGHYGANSGMTVAEASQALKAALRQP